LVTEACIKADGAERIKGAYEDFQQWCYERQLDRCFSEEDILDYPNSEILVAMRDWIKA